jgi:hypothetical protein
MKVIRCPLFLVDVDEAADYLFTEAGEATALRWRDELKRIGLALKRRTEKLGYWLVV